MKFPNKYKILNQNEVSQNEYKIVPIRYEDRFDIMNWRNQQIYHLRQGEPLTKQNQEDYFNNIIYKLFDQQNPNQILFSYLKNDICIGYGGLVHINWLDKNAEISFIINTELEKNEFQFHWKTYLLLIENIAFNQLNFHKIYTYAFDLRPNLYIALESSEYKKEATLKEHCLFNNEFKDVIIHSKINKNQIYFRKVNLDDSKYIFDLANDLQARESSFNKNQITWEKHIEWFSNNLKNENNLLLIAYFNNIKCAFIRYEIIDNNLIIGININPEFRGKKLGTDLITKSRNFLVNKFDLSILAYIKNENIASIKTFEKAGFILYKEGFVNNNPCKIYKYEK